MTTKAGIDEMSNTALSDQLLLRVSFGIAGFVFELILFILLMVLGYGEKDRNMKFQTLVVIVLFGNVISIMDNVFRVSNYLDTPLAFKIFLQLTALLLNVYLTYYVFSYLKSFVKNKEGNNKWWDIMNRAIVVGSTVYAAVMFAQAMVQIHSGVKDAAIPNIGRIIIGYAVELYFLLFSMILVIRYRSHFEKRAFYTALGAYAVIITTIVLQLVQTRGILLNYFGAAIGTYIFYIGVEIPDYRNLKRSLDVVQTLAEAIDAKDTYTHGHSGRVAAYTREIAKRAGYSEKAQNEIYMMGLLHDVGKIGIPDAVINKPGRLTYEEYEEIKKHPVIGAKILGSVREMPSLATGARWHHERYDGNGYPDRLKGENIPEGARIIAVADAYDAMTSNRSYRRWMEQEDVRKQLETGKGTQFDERFAGIMLQMMDEDKEYRMREM